MKDFVKTFIKPYAKAITAALVGGIVALALHFGVQTDDTITIALTTIVGALVNGFLTWLVPNDPPS